MKEFKKFPKFFIYTDENCNYAIYYKKSEDILKAKYIKIEELYRSDKKKFQDSPELSLNNLNDMREKITIPRGNLLKKCITLATTIAI